MFGCREHRGLIDLSCRYCIAELILNEQGPLGYTLTYDAHEGELVGLAANQAEHHGKALLASGLPCVDVWVHVARWGKQ